MIKIKLPKLMSLVIQKVLLYLSPTEPLLELPEPQPTVVTTELPLAVEERQTRKSSRIKKKPNRYSP